MQIMRIERELREQLERRGRCLIGVDRAADGASTAGASASSSNSVRKLGELRIRVATAHHRAYGTPALPVCDTA